MAIKFNTSNLSDIEYQTYTVNKFNGVDYTTTPTNVDDSRAVKISNYLPSGNALVKRYGWEEIDAFPGMDDTKIAIHNIWKAPNNQDYGFIIYLSKRTNENDVFANPSIYYKESLDSSEGEFYLLRGNGLYSEEVEEASLDDVYSYGIQFENKLFILCKNNYYVVSETQEGYTMTEVEKVSYIPTIALAVYPFKATYENENGERESIKVDGEFDSYQPYNLLSNSFKLELVNLKNSEYKNNLSNYDLSKITNKNIISVKILDTVIGSETPIANIGKVSHNNGIIEIKKEGEFAEEPDFITVTIEYDNDSSIIKKMRFGIPFGSYGYRDRLFLSGNPDKPNIDIHSSETNEVDAWMDYTYFPDNAYATFGTSDSKIVGYGMLNNGSMAIFKDNRSGQPNLYFRTYEMMDDGNGNMIEYFPITLSGLTLDNNSFGKIINYGNDLLVNGEKGIYKIMAGESTATQTYYSNEMSYFIRDNLGNDLTNSAHIVYNGFLYVSRKDFEGNYRVYVANQDRYSFIDGRQVYEWWVLDGITAQNFWIFNDKLYFSNNEGFCKFSTGFVDKYFVRLKDVNINGEIFSKDAFIDTEQNFVILSPSNSVFDRVKKSTNIKDSYEDFIKYTTIKFEKCIARNINITPIEEVKKEQDNYVYLELTFLQNTVSLMLPYMFTNETNKFIYKGIEYTLDEQGIDYDIVNDLEVFILKGRHYFEQTKPEETEPKNNIVQIVLENKTFVVKDIYATENNYPLSKCYIDGVVWYFVENENETIEIGDVDSIVFNKFKLSLGGYDIDFEPYKNEVLNDVTFEFAVPIESYWYSKHNSLYRIDYLKTADKITFVADARRGGTTKVGYRTNDSEVKFNTSISSKGFDFNYLDFTNVIFASKQIAKTHTSKKKIKNFSFMQLLFSSTDDDDSTIINLSFRYRYTKNNKGVK